MSFDVSAEAYGRFMGRFSTPLAELLVDAVGVEAGQRALDVGCGAGALTAVLVERLGVDAVLAADPSPTFVEAVRERFPSLDVRRCTAEDLAFGDAVVDVALAQLVVHFMSDPVRGLQQMARTVVPGGLVAAAVWDYGGHRGPVDAFWSAARSLDPGLVDESHLPGVRQGHLEELVAEADLRVASSTELTVRVQHPTFDDWWQPFTLGVGPAGSYAVSLDQPARDRLRERCREQLPTAPFATEATAWTVVARV